MPVSFFILYISLLLPPSRPAEEIIPQFPLVFLASQAKVILQAKFLADDNMGAYMVSRKFGSSGAYADTILYRGHTPNLLSDQGVRHAIPFENTQAEEFLIFATDIQGSKSIRHVFGIDFMKYQNRIYTVTSEYIDERIHYRLILDSLSWPDFLLRVDSIKQKIDALRQLRSIPDRSARNQALFYWLENYFDTYDPDCRMYDVCNWDSVPNDVINWIAASGDVKDAWKAARMYEKWDAINFGSDACRNPDSYGIYYGNLTTFQTREGIDFLAEKIFDTRLPVKERKQALALLYEAALGLYACSVKEFANPCMVILPELRAQLLDQLIPLFHHKDLGYDAFYAFQNVFHPGREYKTIRPAIEKIPELISTYQALASDGSYLRTGLAHLISQHATAEQWNTVSKNENGMMVTLDGVDYDHHTQILSFYLRYVAGKYPITSNPKFRFEMIDGGEIDTSIIKENFQSFRPPVSAYSGHQMKIKVGDLAPGTWRFSASGAGDNQDQNWVSETASFIKTGK